MQCCMHMRCVKVTCSVTGSIVSIFLWHRVRFGAQRCKTCGGRGVAFGVIVGVVGAGGGAVGVTEVEGRFRFDGVDSTTGGRVARRARTMRFRVLVVAPGALGCSCQRQKGCAKDEDDDAKDGHHSVDASTHI